MSREYDHERLTAAELDAALAQLGIAAREFGWLTGTNLRTVRRWFLSTDHPDFLPPPFWVTQTLSLMTLPGGLDLAQRIAETYAIRRADRGKNL